MGLYIIQARECFFLAGSEPNSVKGKTGTGISYTYSSFIAFGQGLC